MILIAIAILGSLAYGASLSLVLPGRQMLGSAAWLALSAGLGWCVFIPALVFVSRQPAGVCIDNCLVTMAYGEILLILGATGNVLLMRAHAMNPIAFNIACVALSNLAMAAVVSRRMSRLHVPPWKTLGLWMIVLNGSGALFFYLLRFLVEVQG
jgi:hypothetical protein